jgi:hypothetical protein
MDNTTPTFKSVWAGQAVGVFGPAWVVAIRYAPQAAKGNRNLAMPYFSVVGFA